MADHEIFRTMNNGNNMNNSNGMNNGNSMNNGNGMNFPETPILPENGIPVDPGLDNIPETPVAPEGGMPVFPGPDNIPVTPIAPENSRPVDPGFSVFPNFPNFSTSPSFPIFSNCPSCPSFPSAQGMGQVRFLNASTNTATVNISIDNTNYAINSRFATLSNYDWISDGFHTVTVRRAAGLRTILLQQNFPFRADEKVTMVLTDSGSGGLNMVQISDSGCNNMPFNAGCYRAANMSYAGSSYDVLLYGGETVFRSIGFQDVTPYKQAMAGSYQFYITNSSNLSVIREIPIIVIGTYPGTGTVSQPLVSFQVDIAAGRKYTSYLIGNTWSDDSFRVLTVED